MAKRILVETASQRGWRYIGYVLGFFGLLAGVVFVARMLIFGVLGGVVNSLLVLGALISLWLVLRYKGYQLGLRAAYAKYDHLFLDAPKPSRCRQHDLSV